MTEKQKINLIKKYMTNVKPISDYQKEWIRKATAKWIFAEKDGSAYCDRCQTEIQIGKTKHKQELECPNCKAKLTVLHKHRMSKHLDDIDWCVIPNALDNKTIMLRYVYVYRKGTKEAVVLELARMVFTIGAKTNHTFEYIDGEWKYGVWNYFRETHMYNYRRMCCLGAKEYIPTFWRELRKLDCFKYFPQAKEMYNYSLYAHSNINILGRNSGLYEKMLKVGMGKFVERDWKMYTVFTWRKPIVPNNKETTLVKMLGLNRNTFEIFKRNQTHEALEFLQTYPNMTEEMFNLVIKNNITKHIFEQIIKANIKTTKVLRYTLTHGCTVEEWLHYRELLIKMDYPLDDSYLFPKDFYKEDLRVSEEVSKKENKETNDKMAIIANALKGNRELEDMFKGSIGLQVVVPESVEELMREGRNLHNCLGGYGSRIAENKTLVFFVRRIEDPTAPYVALEYNHGKIVQCRFDHNETVKDEKIIQFTELLATKLRKENILAA